MRGPYLESGESIVLTTDRVSIDNEVYDAMLTTRQLILIDNLHARFEPRTIPLADIQSVRSGKAATGEPVVIVTVQQPVDAVAGTRIIIFLQEPMENRKHDRDLWVQKLIELSVSGRGDGIMDEVIPAKRGESMRPSIRRWVAPEITRPRSDNFPVHDSRRDAIITIDEPATMPEHPVEFPSSVEEGEPVVELADRGTDTEEIPVRALEPEEQVITGTERNEPADESPDTVADETGRPAIQASSSPQLEATDTPGSITASILAAVRSLTGHPDEILASPQAVTDDGIEEEAEPVELAPQEMQAVQTHLPAFDEVDHGVRTSTQIPEIASEQHTEDEPAAAHGEVRPVGPDSEQDLWKGLPDDEELEFPAGKQDKTPAEEPAGVGIPPMESSPAPRPAPAPGIHPLIIAGGAALCLLLVIAIIILPGIQIQEDHVPVTVTPTIVPTMTLPPPQPTMTPNIVPQEGVRVRIISPGFFTGMVGNPAHLQPVSGSGTTEVKVLDPTDLVSVSVEKEVYTGDELRVEIYNNGTLIASRSTTTPAGSVVMLIDPATGNPPGIPLPTPTTGNITGTGQLEYY